jgi:hypothetical protein
MTEADWLACADPTVMLAFLRRSGRASDRKVRLFAVACCRRLWRLLDKADRKAIEAAEDYAEGLIGLEELAQAGRRATADKVGRVWKHCNPWAVYAVRGSAAGDIDAAAVAAHAAKALAELEVGAAGLEARAFYGYGKGQKDRARRALKRQVRAEEAHSDATWSELQAHAALLRELFGPARAISLPAAVRVWAAGTVPRIAQTIYDEQRFGDLPILADALEEAGRTDADVLEHCRGPGPHTRGCWVVDLILAKT